MRLLQEGVMHIDPPKGYGTWLDYAVATMDVRSAQPTLSTHSADSANTSC